MFLLWCSCEMQSQVLKCLQGAETTQTQIPFADINGDPLPTGATSQAIVTTYQFQCCGEITEWQTYVQPDGGFHQEGAYTIHFQVWRPSPTSGGGGDCYSLVGENRFTSVMFARGDPVRESPQSSDRIEVRPGDVLGYFITSNIIPDQDQGIQLDRSFTNDTVFYADIDAPLTIGPEACPVSIGTGGVLSLSINAAPALTVSLSSSACPQPSVTPTPPPRTEEPTEAPAVPPDGGPDTDTTIIIAPSNTQTTTDTAVVVEGAGSAILPTVIGVVTVTILTASLLTLVVVIAIVKRKTSRSSTLDGNRDMDMQGNAAYSLRIADKSYEVITDANPAYSSRGEMETSTRLPTPSHVHQQQDTTTNIPVESNQCYGTTTPSVDPDQLYATMEGEHNITHTSQQPTAEDYDYVIP